MAQTKMVFLKPYALILIVGLLLAASRPADGGPLAVGICYAGCGTLAAVCFTAAGAVFGVATVAVIAASPMLTACNVAFAGCMKACTVAIALPTP